MASLLPSRELPPDAAAVIHDALQHLPEVERKILVLVILEGYTIEEAANKLGIPSGTAGRKKREAEVKLGEL